jgi:membrane protein implicated in regulation of membrane protease activity
MTFKPSTWFPIATAMSGINIAAVWFAARPGETWHATLHAALAVAFALWAQRLRQRLHAGARAEADDALGALEGEVGTLRQELAEAQERLDFAERMLVQSRERPS